MSPGSSLKSARRALGEGRGPGAWLALVLRGRAGRSPLLLGDAPQNKKREKQKKNRGESRARATRGEDRGRRARRQEGRRSAGRFWNGRERPLFSRKSGVSWGWKQWEEPPLLSPFGQTRGWPHPPCANESLRGWRCWSGPALHAGSRAWFPPTPAPALWAPLAPDSSLSQRSHRGAGCRPPALLGGEAKSRVQRVGVLPGRHREATLTVRGPRLGSWFWEARGHPSASPARLLGKLLEDSVHRNEGVTQSRADSESQKRGLPQRVEGIPGMVKEGLSVRPG